MRKPMVTRTIISTKVTALAVDLETAITSEVELILPRKVTQDKALKKAQKLYNSDTISIVAIRKLEEVEELYGMAEDVFIANAKILDPATRKELVTSTDTQETEN